MVHKSITPNYVVIIPNQSPIHYFSHLGIVVTQCALSHRDLGTSILLTTMKAMGSRVRCLNVKYAGLPNYL